MSGGQYHTKNYHNFNDGAGRERVEDLKRRLFGCPKSNHKRVQDYYGWRPCMDGVGLRSYLILHIAPFIGGNMLSEHDMWL